MLTMTLVRIVTEEADFWGIIHGTEWTWTRLLRTPLLHPQPHWSSTSMDCSRGGGVSSLESSISMTLTLVVRPRREVGAEQARVRDYARRRVIEGRQGGGGVQYGREDGEERRG
jgi:hypothetical protein